jgi:hypothetical protein
MLKVVGRRVVALFASIGRGIGWYVGLIRDGEDDVQGAYPDHRQVSGEQAATQASVTASLMGVGGAGR